jgi:hypothetical protein
MMELTLAVLAENLPEITELVIAIRAICARIRQASGTL